MEAFPGGNDDSGPELLTPSEPPGPAAIADDGVPRDLVVPLDPASGDGVRYPGGKNLAGVYQWIIDLLPTHSVYAEPFVGSGGILRRKPPAMRSYIVDSDPVVIDWWRRLAWPGVEVIQGDGVAWLEAAGEWLDGDAVVYCDPPYLSETRSKPKLYRHEMTDLQHRRMLRVVRELQCRVVISGYPSELYDQALSDWWRDERDVITRGAVMRTEALWSNFDPTVEYSPVRPYIGGDFRERERIGRKVSRWVNRIQRLRPGERRTLLLALLEAERRGSIIDTDDGRSSDRQLELPGVKKRN
jgi:hypothetical protein